MLVGTELLRMDAEELINGPNLEIAVAYGCNPELHAEVLFGFYRVSLLTLAIRTGRSSVNIH
ncbi:MAG: hypothetical protein QM771_12095, partial [Nitrospira sp.]